MQGQHIFMRCWNKQNNAGTWTAAVTEGIVEENVIRDQIEPRCNVLETFAQNTMLRNPSNNVLRMYSIDDGTVVVSRTFWESDRVTETAGRKGAYTISYILTGRDVDAFARHYEGAFDETRFESYDSVVQRLDQSNSTQVTIDAGRSILTDGGPAVDRGIFRQVGFTKTAFIKLMEGLYQAVERDDHIAVMLPSQLRKAWVESGDPATERLMQAILSVLPPPMRRKTGMVSHWSCAVRDHMLRGIHLVFVQPGRAEELAELSRSGVKLIDLDTGRYDNTADIESQAPSYFEYLWDHLDSMREVEELWEYGMTHCGGILKRLASNAGALECVFCIRAAVDEQFQDPALSYRAYVKAAGFFAGVGKAIPEIEEIVEKLLTGALSGGGPVDRELEQAVVQFVERDKTMTRHQAQEYSVLLNDISRGTASKASVNALCNEVLKPERHVEKSLSVYLTSEGAKQVRAVNLRETAFVTVLFSTMARSGEGSDNTLFKSAVTLMRQWAYQFMNDQSWGHLSVIASAYIEYLDLGRSDEPAIRDCYEVLFDALPRVPTKYEEEFAAALNREEKRLYKNPGRKMSDGSLRLALFHGAFNHSLPLPEDAQKSVMDQSCERFFRLNAFRNGPSQMLMEQAGELFLESFRETPLNGNDCPLFNSQIASVTDMRKAAGVWNERGIRASTVAFEKTLMGSRKDYWPGQKRTSFLIGTFGDLDYDTCCLITAYLERMPDESHINLLDLVEKSGQMGRLYVHTLLDEAAGKYRRELEPYINMNHGARLKMLIEAQYVAGNTYDEDRLRETFSEWYFHEFEVAFNAAPEFLKRLSILRDEYAVLKKIGADGGRLRQTATTILDSLTTAQLNTLTKEQLCELPKKAVSVINAMLDAKGDSGEVQLSAAIRMVYHLDSIRETDVVRELDGFCQKYEGDPLKEVIIARLNYYIRHYRDTRDLELAWAYELFRALLADSDRLFPQVMMSGEMTSVLSGMSDEQLVLLMMDMMSSVDFQASYYRKRVDREALIILRRMYNQEPSYFKTEAFLRRYNGLRFLSTEERRFFSRRMGQPTAEPSKKGFGVTAVLYGVAGGILSMLVLVLVLFALHLTNLISTWFAIVTGLVLAALFLTMGLLLRHSAGMRS